MKMKDKETFELPHLTSSKNPRTMTRRTTPSRSRRNRLKNRMRRRKRKMSPRNIKGTLWSMALSILKSRITSNLRTSKFSFTLFRADEMRKNTFFKYLSQQNYLSWIVLLYSVISSAMIPPWLMSIKANKLLRISWRCLLQLFILVPFVLF